MKNREKTNWLWKIAQQPEGKPTNLILLKLRCKIERGPSCAVSEPCKWPPLPAGVAIASHVPDGRNPPGLLLCVVMLPSVPDIENEWPIRRWSNSPKNTIHVHSYLLKYMKERRARKVHDGSLTSAPSDGHRIRLLHNNLLERVPTSSSSAGSLPSRFWLFPTAVAAIASIPPVK